MILLKKVKTLGKILVIAEKPSVAKDIARVLKCTKKADGYVYGDDYIISWAIGHLVTLCDPEDYSEGLKKWAFQTLPIIPEEMKLKAIKNTRSQLKVLHKLMNDRNTDSIICATDSGREGELIFRYIYSITNCTKKVQRLWISSMTDAAISDGFRKLRDSSEYDLLYLSAKCRSEADWLVGINATRAYTLKYNALLSIGRVQTPTLAIIVARQKEIDAFEAKDYYEVQNNYGSFTGTWFLKEYGNTRIEEKEKAEAIAKKVKGKTGVVSKIEKEEKKQSAPFLYDLTELQRDCNKKFGYSAQKTLDLAQALYEKRKLITYPRTDSRYLSDDMKQKIVSTLKKLSYVEEYKEYASYVLNLERLPLSKRIIDNSKVTDHHAIIPTDVNIRLSTLTKEEWNVYNLIALRFLCVFYPNYIYSVTKIVTLAEDETFLSKGTTVLQEGWTALNKRTPEQKEDKREKDKREKDNKDDQTLPDMKENDPVNVLDSKALKKKTAPPKPYTEATLLSAMENAGRFVEDEDLKEQLKESGLGTPATRAAIIERLLTVGYIVRKGKTLIPTPKGLKLIEIVPPQLKSPETTGKWEKGLSSISKGKMDSERFMGSIKRYVHYLIGASAEVKKDIVFEEEKKSFKPKGGSLGKCPLCGTGSIHENSKAYFCSNWKKGCKFTLWKNVLDSYGNTLDANKVKDLLKNKEIQDIFVTMPQTHEKCRATLILKCEGQASVELKAVTRLENLTEKG